MRRVASLEWISSAFEAEFDGEFAGPGFFGDPGVGAALDREASFANGFYYASEARGGFVEGGLYGGGFG